VKFYTFGLQRTCTNFSQALIQENFNFKWENINRQDNPLWKHNKNAKDAMAHVEKRNMFIFCYKEPHMWVDSIMRKHVDFFNRHGGAKKSEDEKIDICIDVFNEFYLNWMQEMPVLHYEIFHQRKMCNFGYVKRKLNNIAKVHDMRRQEWKLPTNVGQTSGFQSRKQNYLEGNPLSLSQEKKSYIISKIDKRIIDFFENQR